MDHRELVRRAEVWLRNSVVYNVRTENQTYRSRAKCSVVITEPSGSHEQPDAVGWCYSARLSVLVECKVSRADFFADQKKFSRVKPNFGIGTYRYYMVPKGLIKPEEVPASWGLLYVAGHRTRVVRISEKFERQELYELALLFSECRKIQIVARGGKLIPTQAGIRIMESMANEISQTQLDQRSDGAGDVRDSGVPQGTVDARNGKRKSLHLPAAENSRLIASLAAEPVTNQS